MIKLERSYKSYKNKFNNKTRLLYNKEHKSKIYKTRTQIYQNNLIKPMNNFHKEMMI